MNNWTLKTIVVLALWLPCCLLSAQQIATEKALADIDELTSILTEKSSYVHLTDFGWKSALQQAKRILAKQDSVPMEHLLFMLHDVISRIGDRHAKVEWEEQPEPEKVLFLPFALAPYEEKAIALQKHRGAPFTVLFPNYPYLKAINAQPIRSFVAPFNMRGRSAPTEAKRLRAINRLRYLGDMLEFYQFGDATAASFTFTDGQKDTTTIIPLSQRRGSWDDIGDIRDRYKRDYKAKNYAALMHTLEGEIAYLALPKMFNAEDHPLYFELLKNKMEAYRNTKAMIIDIRGNSGGSRMPIWMLASYICAPDQTPQVVNMAYIRETNPDSLDLHALNKRYLYPYDSPNFNAEDRKAIDAFLQTFKTAYTFDKSLFSEAHYTVFSHRNGKDHYHYDKPVYLLMNEQCFSAAGVLAATFKGLPNVKLVGVNTDGSSGLSNYFRLKNSGLIVKLSTMISFQPDGRPLDGFGTAPDIELPRTMEQVLGEKDSQLEAVLQMIKQQ
ncbi:MAG: S41 family peptidase [Bacteroidota bacterium]